MRSGLGWTVAAVLAAAMAAMAVWGVSTTGARREMEREAARLRAAVEAEQRNKASVAAQLTESRQELEEARRQLSQERSVQVQLGGQVRDAQTEITRTTAAARNVTGERDDLAARVKALEGDLRQREAEVASLRRTGAEATAERDSLARKTASLNDEIQRLKTGAAASERSERAEDVRTQEDLARLTRDRDTARKEADTLRKQLSAAQAEVRKLEKTNDGLQAELRNLQRENAGLKSENQRLKSAAPKTPRN